MIAIAGYHDSPVSVADEVAELVELGLAGMKLKVGSADLTLDVARVREARSAGGPDFVLAADANQRWTRDEAVRFARLVEDQDLVWLEEPCRWDNDRRFLRDVRQAARVPVCAGQTELSAAGCLELMTGGSVDVCNFDSSWSGGPTEWRRVAAAAQVLGVAMAHHEEPQVAGHLLASIPHGTVVECFHPDRDPIWWNLVANRPQLVDGRVQLPDSPGLGWELDLEYLEAHALV
jgi:L-alanine-DL-glutamate epimerase-like enolase superfamily enzyme